jgi:hypothetical protein
LPVASSAPSAQAAQASRLLRPLQTSSNGRPLQRATVAGCNVPGVPANVIGMAAHEQIELDCEGRYPGCTGEFPIPGDGVADMVRQSIPTVPEIGEIKPASWLGRGLVPLAAAQLGGYLAAYTAAFPGPAPTPMWTFAYRPAPFIGNPSQVLSAWGPAGGLYFYRCTSGRRRRVRVPVRVPVTPPVTVTPGVPVPGSPPVTSPSGPTPGQVAAGAVGVGAAVGIGYLIYRGVRLIPSIAVPPTLIPNLLIP